MSQKTPRSARALRDRAGRARNPKELGGAFKSQHIPSPRTDFKAVPRRLCPADTSSVPLSPYVEAQASSAQQLAAAMHDLVAMALALEGPKALDAPKSSAAFHEAGHCVVDALYGATPTRATIWPIREFGQPQWIGRTEGLRKWSVDRGTPAEADLKNAQSQLAGVVAESLFDRANYRLASSIDEIVTAQSIVASAAIKIHRDPEALWQDTLAGVASKLKANKKIIHRIADTLLRRGVIRSRQLDRLLREVRAHNE